MVTDKNFLDYFQEELRDMFNSNGIKDGKKVEQDFINSIKIHKNL